MKNVSHLNLRLLEERGERRTRKRRKRRWKRERKDAERRLV